MVDDLLAWAKGGIDVPALRERVDLLPDEQFALDCYMSCATSRPPTMGALPVSVPMSEIKATYEFLELDDMFRRQEWVALVIMLDAVVIEDAREKKKNRDKKPQPVA